MLVEDDSHLVVRIMCAELIKLMLLWKRTFFFLIDIEMLVMILSFAPAYISRMVIPFIVFRVSFFF